MNFGLREEIFQKICNIASKYQYQFFIFGSRARGDYRKNSDIDIAIFGNVTSEEKYAIRNEFDKIDMEYMLDIVFVEDITKNEFIENIRKEGLLIQ